MESLLEINKMIAFIEHLQYAMDYALSFTCTVSIDQHYKVSIIIISILQMRTLRLREAKKIVICHKANKRQNGIWEPRLSDCQVPCV